MKGEFCRYSRRFCHEGECGRCEIYLRRNVSLASGSGSGSSPDKLVGTQTILDPILSKNTTTIIPSACLNVATTGLTPFDIIHFPVAANTDHHIASRMSDSGTHRHRKGNPESRQAFSHLLDVMHSVMGFLPVFYNYLLQLSRDNMRLRG